MRLLKIFVTCFFVLFLLFLAFRLITAPSTDSALFVIIVASCLAGTTTVDGRRWRWFRRNS